MGKIKDVILSVIYAVSVILIIGGVITLKVFWYCRTSSIEFKWLYPIGITIPVCAFTFWRISQIQKNKKYK